MSKNSLHILYAGLGGHFDYVQKIIGDSENTHLIFIGTESIPQLYLNELKFKEIPFTYIHVSKFKLNTYLKLKRTLVKLSPTNIYIHSNAATLPVLNYIKHKSVKVIFVEHHNFKLKSNKDWKRSKIAHNFFDHIVFLSESSYNGNQQKLKNLFSITKSIIIPTGIEIESTSKNYEFKNNIILFGMQSRLVPIKDHETLLHSFQKFSLKNENCELRIAGDGSELEKLKQRSIELKINDKVKFLGMLSKDKLSVFLDELDIYIHASLGETNSIAILEAGAKGLPIIASDVSGINDLFNRGLLKFYEAQNIVSLTNAMEELSENQDLREQLGKAMKQHLAQTASIEKMKESFKALN